VTGDGNNLADIFVRDLQAGTTTRASVGTTGGDSNSITFASVSISADGRYVAFYSLASNLVPRDTNGVIDAFVRDMVCGQTIVASTDRIQRAGNRPSENPSMSPDGRFVAFSSAASDLVPGDVGAVSDVFIKDVRLITVDATSPTSVARGATDVVVTITGTGFEAGNSVQVHRQGAADVTLTDVTVISETEIRARLSIPADVPTGKWDARVWKTTPVGSAAGQCSGCLQIT
jgi:Tol biopolymer transport system component